MMDLTTITRLMLMTIVFMHVTSQTVTEISIDTSQIVHETSDKFISVAIDSGVLRRHWEKFEPQSEKVRTLASALTPSYLRVGGTDANFLIFEDGSGSSKETNVHLQNQITNPEDQALKFEPKVVSRSKRDVGLYSDHTNFTMSAELYDQLHAFVVKVGFDLIFDLNVLLRRGDDWDSENAKKLMEYTVKQGYKMAGWELGNEPDDTLLFIGKRYISPVQLVKDFHSLQNLTEGFPAYKDNLILGPSVCQLSSVQRIAYFNSFLTNGGKDVVTGATFHQYYVNGRIATIDNFTNHNILNVLFNEVQMGVNLTRAAGTKAVPWLGETSSAWGGGAEGLSDRYVAAFMWLDKLGISAAWGIDVVIRQTFYGGHYALIDSQTLDPNPDYWLTLMYKTLVGSKVLRVLSPSEKGTLRVYAHCVNTDRSKYQKGSIVYYIMNIDEVAVNVTFHNFPSNTPVEVYTFTPQDGDIKSQSVLLNGQLLQMVDNSTLPDLHIPRKGTAPVYIQPLTYSFVVLPNADLSVCK